MNLLLKQKFVAGFSLFAAAGFFTAGYAQTPAATNEEPVTLEKFEVTGSIIPQAAGTIASPVTSINADILDMSVVTTNAMEVLRKTVPQFQGNANLGSSNANIGSSSTGGGSQASLRNLTTLTLINGRRAAASPITGTGGNQFVDLNIIPLAAISSIDVLLDGASATYGSDATSGVINIRSKSDYNGAQIGGFYSWSPNDGKWANRGGEFVVGASNGKTSITVAGGYQSQDPLYQFERGFSAVSYGTPTFGGVINFGSNYFVLNPKYPAPPVAAVKPVVKSTSFPMTTIPTAPDGKPYFGAVGSDSVYWGKNSNGAIVGFGAGELAGATTPEAEKVAFNLARYVTLLQERTSRGVMVTWDHKINDQITFFGDVLTSQIDTKSQINAQPVGTNTTFNVDSTYVYNPFDTGVGTNTANTVRVRNRFVTNPRVYTYDTNFFRIVGGFRGDINDRVSYETAVNLNKSKLAFTNPGVIDSAGLLAAAGITPRSAGPINMFARSIDPAVVAAANFIGVATNNFDSTLDSWDGRVIVKAFQIQGNDVSLALGSEFRRETLNGTADLNSIPDAYGNIKWTGATSVNPFTGSRKVTAFYAEALIPVTSPQNAVPFAHSLNFDLAIRHEKYSDTDDPTVPKISFKWLPVNDEFAIRGTFGKSFNAPTLYQVMGPSDVGFTPTVVLLPYGAADQPGNYVEGQGQIRGGSNPKLKPAKSDAYTFGLVYSPKALKGFSAELTYWHVKEKDVVGVISSQSILQDVEDNGPNSKYIRDLPNGQPNPAYTGDRNNPVSYDVKLDGFGTDGVAITAPGQVAGQIDSIYMQRPLENIAEQKASGIDLTLHYKFDWASVAKFRVDSNTAYWLQYVFDGEELDGRATTTGGTIPRWSNYTLITATRGNIEAFVGNRYIPKVNAPEETSGRNFMESYDSVDLGVSYTFDGRFASVLKGLKVTLAVDNVTNSAPPLAPDTFTEANADTSTYNPVGRTYLVRADFKF
jgi:iron complex outermembrane receptor protein